MRQIFLKLYVLLVCAMIGFGWLLDQLWFTVSDKDEARDSEFHVKILADQFSNSKRENWEGLVERYNSLGSRSFELIPEQAIQLQDNIKQRVIKGEVVDLGEYNNKQTFIVHIPRSQYYLLSASLSDLQGESLRKILLVFFYISIAVVVFVWLRPVNRTINLIEQGAMHFSNGNWGHRIPISSSSPFGHLSATLNQMAGKIQALLQSHKDLTNAISHEFRTPLARMKFSLEMLYNSNDSKYIQEQHERLVRDVAELDQLVSELLTLAKLEREVPVLSLESGLPKDFLGELVGKLSETCPHLKIQLDIKSGEQKIKCDFHLMLRAVQNILINAIRYAKTKIEIQVHVYNGFCAISICDDGKGIAEDKLDDAFKPFERLDEKTSSGYGLGLSIAKKILEWHKGTITYKRSSLGGACFILSWPY